MESPTDKKVEEFKSPKPSIKTSFDIHFNCTTPISSHTPEYVIATAALSLSGTLFMFALFLLFGRFKYWKQSNKKNIAWKDIFKPNNL